MNNKILLGSIIAVVILVLVSFTGVVGYQTTKSSTIARASPLFSVRSKRAIDEESKDLTCDYVGKGEKSILSIPKRNDRTALQQKFIDRISKMDEETFNRFKNLVIGELHKNNAIKEMDIPVEIGKQPITGIPIPICDEWTIDYPILCDLDNLFYTLLSLLEKIILILLLPLIIIFDPPTWQPLSTYCPSHVCFPG